MKPFLGEKNGAGRSLTLDSFFQDYLNKELSWL